MVKSTKIGQNFAQLAITFDSVTQLQYKLHFRKALIITFRMMYNFQFRGGPNFTIVFSNENFFDAFWQTLCSAISVQSFIGLSSMVPEIFF